MKHLVAASTKPKITTDEKDPNQLYNKTDLRTV